MLQFFSAWPDSTQEAQVHAVARHAQDETVAGIIITAAMTGLRMGEVLELRWRDVHFSESVVHVQRSYAAGLGVSSPKGRRGRSVPLADQVARVLARLGQRERFTGRDALISATPTGEHVDPATLRTRYAAARDVAAQDDPRTAPHHLSRPAALLREPLRCFGY